MVVLTSVCALAAAINHINQGLKMSVKRLIYPPLSIILCVLLASPLFAQQATPDKEAIKSATEPAANVVLVGAEQETLKGLEQFLDGVVLGMFQAYQIPGISVSIVHGDKVALSKGYGYADVARTRSIDPAKTLFRAGSVSKPFTWTAVMQLVEQGLIDLDTDVNVYLEAFKIPETYDEPVTMRHILSHSAGFEDGALGYLFRKTKDDTIGLENWLIEFMPKRVRPPGEFTSYSNFSTALAGYIVAEVSGQSFESYVEDNIFTPLDMAHTTFHEPVPPTLAADQSDNFLRKKGDFINANFEFISDAGPAGAVSTTAADIANFMIAHLNEGAFMDARILNPETVRQMRTRLLVHHNAAPAFLFGFYEKFFNGRVTYGHGGDTIHFHSELSLLPSEKVGIFVTSNAPDGGVAVRHIVSAFFDEYFPLESGDPHPLAPNGLNEGGEAKVDKAVIEALSKYTGAYRYNRRSFSTWEKFLALQGDAVVSVSPDGALMLARPGVKPQKYAPLTDDGAFRSIDDPDQIIAFRVDQGKDRASHLFVSPTGAFERIAPLEAAQLHLAVLGFCLLAFVGVVIGALWGAPKWIAMPGKEKLARAVLFAGCLLSVGFVAVFVVTIAMLGDDLVYVGLPYGRVILSLPLAILVCAAVGIFFSITAWRDGYWSWLGRLRYSSVVVLLALFVAISGYWNLLGPWNIT